MNKWYFTKNNTITEPMDFEAAKKFVAANLDSYGWQQSFTQWLPVHCINDFAGIVPEAKPLPLVPQGVVDEFNSKSKKIIDNISKVNSDISSGEKLLQVFAQEIDTYKKMTVKLSPEVQANINSIEEHYLVLQKQLQDIKQTTNTTANEVSQVVSNFNLKITDKSVASITSELQKNIAKQINKSDAFIAAWLLGSEGYGVAEVLFGDHNFKGKLPHSWPKYVKDYQNKYGPNFWDDSITPLYKYGYGLEY